MESLPQQAAATFQLNTATLQVLGAIGGMLVGGIVFLTRQLLSSKDEQIRETKREAEYWQSMALGLMGSAHRAITLVEQQLPVGISSDPRKP